MKKFFLIILIFCSSMTFSKDKILSKVFEANVIGSVEKPVNKILELGCSVTLGFIDMLQKAVQQTTNIEILKSQNSFINYVASKYNYNDNAPVNSLEKKLYSFLNSEEIVQNETTSDVIVTVAPYPFEINYSDNQNFPDRKLILNGESIEPFKILKNIKDTWPSGLRCYSPKDGQNTIFDENMNANKTLFDSSKTRLCRKTNFSFEINNKTLPSTELNSNQGLNPKGYLCPGQQTNLENEIPNPGVCQTPSISDLVLIRTAYEIGFLMSGNPVEGIDSSFWITESYFIPYHVNSTGEEKFELYGTFNVFQAGEINNLGELKTKELSTEKTVVNMTNLPLKCKELSLKTN